ncbi:protein crumbs homolog 3 isoform X2 [Callithrix jacchus]|uniref:Crumbs cell polarity complex component 3 n=1 Tax=Callithrix jacchus TaxID=9483 RepID=F6Z7P9_CALJA|nr:protein crumbs homolog 3 isoform X2 [Callithrix jacchus]
MANPGLGLLLALGLPFLLARWGRAWGQVPTSSANESSTVLPTSTSPSSSSSSNGTLSQGAITAIIVVFSILAALLLAVGLALLVRKLREKRQTEGTYRPSSEEQFSHAAEARAPQDSKETVRGCLPI